MNKPLLSLNDLLSVWSKSDPFSGGIINDSAMYERIKKLSQEKLSK